MPMEDTADLKSKLETEKFDQLIQKTHLTNREVGDVARVLANRVAGLSENDGKLYKILKDLGPRLDRLERAMFDTMKDGEPQKGVVRSLRETQLIMGVIQRKLTEVHLHNQVVRQFLPWLMDRVKASTAENVPVPTIDEMNVKYNELLSTLIEEGEKAVQYHQVHEEAIKAVRRCEGCLSWRSIQVGDDAPGCVRKFVQLKCPQCGFLCPKPVGPNAPVSEKCPKCQAQLLVQTKVPPILNFCANYKMSTVAIRQECLTRGISAEFIDAIHPMGATSGQDPAVHRE